MPITNELEVTRQRVRTTVSTREGEVLVLTRRLWWWVFPKPHTTLTPRNSGRAGKLGVSFHWSTTDPEILKAHHRVLVQIVQDLGLNFIRTAADANPSAFGNELKPVLPYLRRID